MSNLAAVGSKLLIDNGRERRTDGLLRHLGLADVASFRVTGYDPPRSGRGTELIFYGPGGNGVLQAYDRDTSHYLDLYLNARYISLQPQEGGKVTLPAGTVQQLIGSWVGYTGWTSSAPGTWLETEIQTTVTCTGVPLRLEFGVTAACNTAGQYARFAVGIDGSGLGAAGTFTQAAAGYANVVSGVWYYTPSAGVHRFSIFVYVSGGAMSFDGGSMSRLYVTEQRA